MNLRRWVELAVMNFGLACAALATGWYLWYAPAAIVLSAWFIFIAQRHPAVEQ